MRRETLIKYLSARRSYKNRSINLDAYEEEWFTVNKLVVDKVITWHTLHRAINRGEVELDTIEELRPFIHRDELNRFLRENTLRPSSERENIAPRLEIPYTSIFTGVQSSQHGCGGNL